MNLILSENLTETVKLRNLTRAVTCTADTRPSTVRFETTVPTGMQYLASSMVVDEQGVAGCGLLSKPMLSGTAVLYVSAVASLIA
jgi:hypothetical protein